MTNLDEEVREFEEWLFSTLQEWSDFDPDSQIGMTISSKLSDIRQLLTQTHNAAVDECLGLLVDENVDMGRIKADGYEAGCWDNHTRNQLRAELRKGMEQLKKGKQDGQG